MLEPSTTDEHLPFYIRGLKNLFTRKASRRKLTTTTAVVVALSVTLPAGAASADDLGGLSNFGFSSSSALTTTSSWDLVGSGYNLSDMDLMSGSITGSEFGQTLSIDHATQVELMNNDMMAIDTARLALEARKEAEARQKAADEAKKTGAYASGADASGCPTSAPANTLRGGSESIGVAELCARSVAQARNPQAAAAIKYTLNNLGKPYSQPKRNQDGWYDCSSYTTRAYQSAGVNIAPPGQNAPSTRTMRVARWAVQIPFSELKPGDLVQPTSGHVAMWLADGWVVHTNRPGDVSHVRKAYTSAYWAAYVDPARV